MRLHSVVICLVLLVGVGLAQKKQTPAAKPAGNQKDTKPAAPTAAKPAAAESKPPSTTPAAPGLPSEATVKSFLEHVGIDPKITFRIGEIKPSKAAGLTEVVAIVNTPQGPQPFRFFITADQKYAISGELMPFGADPFAQVRSELAQRQNGIPRGPENAAVTIYEFSDMQCPGCKQAQPLLEKLLTDMPNVRLVWQHYPLPSHSWAFKAATYGDCLGRSNNAAYWKFVNAVFAAQQTITDQNADEKLKEAVTTAGGDANAVATCAAQPASAERVKASIQLGRDLEVNSTPTIFVGGRKLANFANMPYDMLKQLVESQGKPAQAAK
jgi:protein-disulfide isomerase